MFGQHCEVLKSIRQRQRRENGDIAMEGNEKEGGESKGLEPDKGENSPMESHLAPHVLGVAAIDNVATAIMVPTTGCFGQSSGLMEQRRASVAEQQRDKYFANLRKFLRCLSVECSQLPGYTGGHVSYTQHLCIYLTAQLTLFSICCPAVVLGAIAGYGGG